MWVAEADAGKVSTVQAGRTAVWIYFERPEEPLRKDSIPREGPESTAFPKATRQGLGRGHQRPSAVSWRLAPAGQG